MKRLLTSFAAWSVAAAASVAGLTFEETLLEFHPAVEDTHVTADFAFRNDGDAPVRIAKYDAACTCMDVGVSGGRLQYAPGEVGTIRAVFRLAGYSGTTDRVVAIWLEGDPPAAPSARLTVRAHIPELMMVEPNNLSWDLHKEAQPKTISIEIDPSVEIRVKRVQSSSDNFEVELKTLEQGRSYELVVVPRRTDTPGLAAIRIDTDSEIESLRTHTAFGVVRNPPAQR